MIAETRRVGNANGSLRGDSDFGLDHVFHPVALAGRDIAGKDISWEGGDRDIVRAADATFEHAAAPYRNIFGEAIRLHCSRTGMAANAAELNIYDAGGSEFYGGFCVPRVLNPFVKTKRPLLVSLQLGMCGDIVPPKPLFHH